MRALAPLSDGDVRPAEGVFQHRQIPVTWYQIPFFSNSGNGGSTDAAYLSAERDGIQTMLPRLIAEGQPDLVIVGRESIAWNEALTDSGRSFRSVILVHGGTTFASLEANTPEANHLLGQFQSVDLVITVAQHLAQRLARLGLSRLCAIPNPVDVRRFRPAAKDAELMHQLRIRDDNCLVLHASKLTSIKRPLDLVESAQIAVRQDARLIYLIVGDGPCRALMEDACRRSGIAHAFRFLGWLDHRSLPRFFNLADLVILPSESEGQSLVCLEAQAAGRCVLSTDIPGAREVIDDGETGLLFPKGNIDALTQKTLWAAANAQARDSIGQNAHVAAQSHDVDVIVARYAATFLELCTVGRESWRTQSY